VLCCHNNTPITKHTTKNYFFSVLPGRTFSRDGGSAPDAPEAGALCRSSDPLSGRSDSRVIVLCFRACTQCNDTREGTITSHTCCLDPVKDAAKQLAVPLRETVKQEREPSLGPPSPSPGSFALPLSTDRFLTTINCHNPCPGPGILTWFPFADRCDALREEGDADHMRKRFFTASPHTTYARSHALVRALPHRLGPANPCPTAVHMEPFSTSAFKVV
jgi:hypothetical protein